MDLLLGNIENTNSDEPPAPANKPLRHEQRYVEYRYLQELNMLQLLGDAGLWIGRSYRIPSCGFIRWGEIKQFLV